MAKTKRSEIVAQIRKNIRESRFTDPVKREQFRRYLDLAGPLLQELAEVGFDVETLDDLRHQGKPWQAAIPILSRWLTRVEDLNLKESIVRCLSVPWTKDETIAKLIAEFRKYAIFPDP